MKSLICAGLYLLLIALMLGCGKEDSTSPPPTTQNNPPSETFVLPFEEHFDGSETEIRTRWTWVTNAGAGLMWELDSADKASGTQSIRTPQLDSGWGCAQSTQICWSAQILRTVKPIDLTSKTSAQLTFMNKRTTTTLSSAPGCWSDMVSENAMAFCIYWNLDTNINNWQVLQTFTGNISQWTLATVSLNSLVGRKVYLGFRQKSHCTERGNLSASWQVDEIAITGN